MPAVSEQDNGDGTKTVHFAETPICSTYLVAFIVGELEGVEGKTKEGVDVSPPVCRVEVSCTAGCFVPSVGTRLQIGTWEVVSSICSWIDESSAVSYDSRFFRFS
jgi:hypothetical protein